MILKTENISSHENLNEIMQYVLSYDDGPIICNVKIKTKSRNFT